MNSVRFPKYAYDTLQEMEPNKRQAFLYSLFAYLFEGVEPQFTGWDLAMFALIVADLEEREKITAEGGSAAERFLQANG